MRSTSLLLRSALALLVTTSAAVAAPKYGLDVGGTNADSTTFTPGNLIKLCSGPLRYCDAGTATGPQGPQGDPGADGVDGDSAYELALSEGFIGTLDDWLDSLIGPVGPQGPAGADGADGADGATGAQGNKAGLRYEMQSGSTPTAIGHLCLNSVTVSVANTLRIAHEDLGNVAHDPFFATWDDSTTTSSRGYIVIKANDNSDPVTLIYRITGAGTSVTFPPPHYYEFPVSYVSGSRPTTGTALAVEFWRTGDMGATGATGATGDTGPAGADGADGADGVCSFTTVQDEGVDLTQRAKANFIGPNITCVDDAANDRINCTTTDAGLTQAYQTIQDEGTARTQRFTMNFIGTSISCVDNAGNARTDCTITDDDTPECADMPALAGDVTTPGGSCATTIPNNTVTLAKQADMATASLVYRKTAGTGDPEVQTLATLRSDLELSDGSWAFPVWLSGDHTGPTGTTWVDLFPSSENTATLPAGGHDFYIEFLLGRTAGATNCSLQFRLDSSSTTISQFALFIETKTNTTGGAATEGFTINTDSFFRNIDPSSTITISTLIGDASMTYKVRIRGLVWLSSQRTLTPQIRMSTGSGYTTNVYWGSVWTISSKPATRGYID